MTIGRVSSGMLYDMGAGNITAGNSSIFALQEKLSTGKRINAPSDDPVGAAQVSLIKDRKAVNDSYLTGIAAANTQVSTAANQISTAVGTLQTLMELAVQARNGAYKASDLASLGDAAKGAFDQLLATANAQDGQGSYIFSGSKNQTKPFQFDGANYTYQGDQTPVFVRTGSADVAQTAWSGVAVFQSALQADGNATASAAPGNQGNAFVADVRAQNASSYAGGAFTVSYAASPTDGKLTQTITDASSAIVAGPTTYEPGMSANFGGVHLEMNGTPQPGDTFTVGPAKKINLLDVAGQFVDLLRNAGSRSKSELANGLAEAGRSLSNGMDNLLTNQSLMGAQLAALDTKQSAVESDSLDLETQRSNIEDLDYAKGITDLQRQKTALEASMQSFTSIASLSLFNFLR